MQIFNNGKYKSLLAAESGELAEIAQTVKKDKDFRPHFHIAPPTGLMNDPNGLIFDAFDFVSGNILFMLTALGCALFVGFVLKDEAKKELSPTPDSTFTKLWFNYVKFVVPFIILVIFISNLL